MKIPTKFKAVNLEWSVVDMPQEIADNNSAWGITYYDNARIEIRVDLNTSQREHTIFHELLHVIFNALGRDDLNKDEALLDAISGVQHQIEQTKRGNLHGKK